jgi:hypothetical protein
MAAVPAFGKGHEVVATIEAFHAKIVLLRAAIELLSLPGSFILTLSSCQTNEVVKRSKEMLSLVPCCPSNYSAAIGLAESPSLRVKFVHVEYTSKRSDHRDG